MRETTNFNFKIPEGTDIVNPIIDPYRNWDSIDPILKTVKDSTITTASHVKNGDTHVLIRDNSECNNIKFVATGDWRLGDSLTVDGVTVQCRLTDGESVHSNAFVTNQEVFCILHGQMLTMYLTESTQEIKDDITQVKGSIISINNDLSMSTPLETTAQNVHGAINENKTAITNLAGVVAENLNKLGEYELIKVEVPNVTLPANTNHVLIDVSSQVKGTITDWELVCARLDSYVLPFIGGNSTQTSFVAIDNFTKEKAFNLNYSNEWRGYTYNLRALVLVKRIL